MTASHGLSEYSSDVGLRKEQSPNSHAHHKHTISEQRRIVSKLEKRLSDEKSVLARLEAGPLEQNADSSRSRPKGREALATIPNHLDARPSASLPNGIAAHRADASYGGLSAGRNSQGHNAMDRQVNVRRGAPETASLPHDERGTPRVKRSKKVAIAGEPGEGEIDERQNKRPKTPEARTQKDSQGLRERSQPSSGMVAPAPANGAASASATRHGVLRLISSNRGVGRGQGSPSVDSANRAGEERARRDDNSPYKIVVPLNKHDRTYLALRCPIGGSNAIERTKKFFAGMQGLRMHMFLAHSTSTSDLPTMDVGQYFSKYPQGGSVLTQKEAIMIRRRAPGARISENNPCRPSDRVLNMLVPMAFCPGSPPDQQPAEKVPASSSEPKKPRPSHQAKSCGRQESSRGGSSKRTCSGGFKPYPKRHDCVLDEAEDSSQSRHEMTRTDESVGSVTTPVGHDFGSVRSPSPPVLLRKQRIPEASDDLLSKLHSPCLSMMPAIKVTAGVQGTEAQFHVSNERSTSQIGCLPVRGKVAVEARSGV